MHLSFFVPGMPVQKGNIKFARGRYFHKEGKRLETWSECVSIAAGVAMHESGEKKLVNTPISGTAHFYMLKPKKTKAKDMPAVKPDLDKLARGLWDPMEGIVFDNDSRICSMVLKKSWAEDASKVGVAVTIQDI